MEGEREAFELRPRVSIISVEDIYRVVDDRIDEYVSKVLFDNPENLFMTMTEFMELFQIRHKKAREVLRKYSGHVQFNRIGAVMIISRRDALRLYQRWDVEKGKIKE